MSVKSSVHFVLRLLSAILLGFSCAGAKAQVDDQLIERGRLLFLYEAFGGNGRTCATCHRPDNNYTIDPTYISRLPPADPLFVSEWDPGLAGLERPHLLRQVGLVAVHSDGYDNPAVFRAVPSLSGLRQTMQAPPELNRGAALGSSGDGAPIGGSLREFIASAVIDHLPKTLARLSGSDYRLPADDELAALEAFILSLGPPTEFDISRMIFTADQVEQGKLLFMKNEKSGPCSDCHRNAGGLDASGVNGLFNIGIQHHLGGPALLVDPTLPADGGFGAEFTIVVAGGRTGFGDGRFNPPSLVEAADTPPYFHDNSASTLEFALHFYDFPTFRTSLEGSTRPNVVIERFEIASIAAFLRTINALENMRSADAMIKRTLIQDLQPGLEWLRMASADTEDAVRVLYGAAGIYPTSIRLLFDALVLENQALAATSVPARNDLAARAAGILTRARTLMVR